MPDKENEEKKVKVRFSLSGFNRRILIFLVLVIATAVVLRPIQLTLQKEMEKARDLFIGNAEEFLGLKIEYGSLGPSIFGVLDIRHVLILREDNSVILSIDRLRLSYSLLALFKGVRIDAFHSVRIDRPVLSLDFEKDAELWERLSSLRGETSSQTAPIAPQNFKRLLPENFSFRIWNGESDFSDSFGSLMLRGVRVDASVRQNKVSFQGRWNAQLSLSEISSVLLAGTSSPVQAAISGRISGEYSGDLGEGSATVEIPSITGNFFRLRPVSFGFFLFGNQLEVRKMYDRSPAAFSLVYDFDNRKLASSVEAENLSLRDLLSFTGDFRKYNNALAFRVSGRMNLEACRAGLEMEDSDSFQLNVNFSGNGSESSFLKRASLEIAANGNKDQITIDTFNFSSSSGGLEFKGGVEFIDAGFKQFAPYGFLSLSDFRLRGKQGVSGELSLNTIGQDINLFAENLTSGSAKLTALDLSLHQERDGIAFALSAFDFDDTANDSGYENDLRISTIFINGSSDYYPRQIQANVRLDSFALGDILSFVEPFISLSAIPSVARFAADDLSVTTEVFFITDFNHVLYDAPRVIAAYEGLQEVLAAISFSGTDRGIELSSARITWGNITAEFNGYADFSNPDDISFSLGTSFQNFTYSFEGMIQNQKNISIRGSYGIQAMLVADEFGYRTGYARGDFVPIPSGSNFASLSFLFSFSYDSPEYWRTRIEKFEISSLTTPSSSAALLRFTGEANERGLRIPNLLFDDGRGALSGNIAINWDTAYKNFGFRTDIASNNRSEFYTLEGAYRDKKLSLAMSGQGMQFSRFSAINASVDGNFRLLWESPASFEAEMTLPSFVMRWQNEVIRVSAYMNANNDELLAQQLKINFSGLEVSIPKIRIDRPASLAETEAEIWGMLSKRPVDILLSANAKFNPADTWVDLFNNFKFLNAVLTVESAYYSDIASENPFSFSFDCRQDVYGYTMSLNGGPKDMLRFQYNPERGGGGIFYTALSSPSPVRGTLAGFFNTKSKSIDAQGSDLYVDLGSLSRFLPPDSAIEFPGGIVTASIRVAGSLEDPEFYGTARGTSIQMVVPQFIPVPIRPVPATFVFNGNEITFGPVDAIVGGGGGKVFGWFRFDQWIPNIFSINVQVPQETPIPYDLNISGFLANGLASGKLVLSMEDMILSINGDLMASETEMSVNAGEMALAQEGRGDFDSENQKVSVVTDIDVRTGRRVEFLWPSVDFPVIQANADLGTGVHITSDSLAKRFTLTGDVKLRSGEIFYLERNFYIREGTLFFKESETKFDPRISARAEIRDRAEVGPVTISMIIDNAPLRSFSPRFVSTPPLSQLEIYSLLGQAPQGGGGEGEPRNLAASVVMDSVAQFAVINRLQRQVRNFLGMDMLSMRTQLLQNVVIQAAGSQFSDNASGKPFRLGNYFDNTTVFLGKYFGADLFGEAMFSFKYDENKIDWGGLVLEPELGFELRNPLFNIQFNMVLMHPENLFINDTSFFLVWRRSF